MSLINSLDAHIFNQNGHESLSDSGILDYKLAFFSKLVRGITRENINMHVKQCVDELAGLSNEEIFTNIQDLMVMMTQTRDIINGKGERQAFYDFLLELYKYFPEIIEAILPAIAMIYGSWLDLNNLWVILMENKKSNSDSYIYSNLERVIIASWVCQLQEDFLNHVKKEQISLASKWAPRIRKGNNTTRANYLKNLGQQIALELFSNTHDFNLEGKIKSRSVNSIKTQLKKKPEDPKLLHYLKLSSWNCYKRYRSLCSTLNTENLKTVETIMCDPAKIWDTINPSSVPAKSLKIYRKAFLNKPNKKQEKNGKIRSISTDRIQCAKNFQETTSLHGARLQIHELVTQALSCNFDEISQKQYNDIMKNIFHGESDEVKSINMLENAIIMCDTSHSMTWSQGKVKPLHAAMGLSEIASQLSKPPFQNRVLTFSSSPEWIKLPESIYKIPTVGEKKIHEIKRAEWEISGLDLKSGSFMERMEKLQNAPWGGNTDFYKAMELILKSCLEAKLTPEEVKKLTLFVFSDMQFDASRNQGYETSQKYTWDHEYQVIKKMFSEAGLESIHSRPFDVPFIVFWNLQGNTRSHPVTADQEGVAYLSGFSQSSFQGFMDGTLLKGNDKSSSSRLTPLDIFRNTMDNNRYDPIREICEEQKTTIIH